MGKLIIFDLDDCLVDTWGSMFPQLTNQAVEEMVKAGLKVLSFEKAAKRLAEINEGAKDGTDAITTFLKEINADASYLEAGKKGFYNFNFEYSIKPLPGVMELLQKARALGVAFGLVTKGNADGQMEKLKRAGIDKKLFQKILVVEDYDKTKPYQEIMEGLKFLPQDCFVVGDRYKTDLLPAKALGMTTIWVPWGRGKNVVPKAGEVDYTVHNLQEIVAIVGRK